MKRFKLFIATLIFFQLACAQLPDSLVAEFNAQKSYSDKVVLLEKLSNKALRSNLELFNLIANQGIELSSSMNDDSVMHRFQIKKGIYYTYKDQFDTARSIYQTVLQSPNPDMLLKVTAYSEIGNTYYYESNDAKALEHYVYAHELLKSTDHIGKLASLSNNIGNVYRYLGDHASANNYLKKALKYKIEIGDSASWAGTLHNLGINYDEMGNLDSAIYYINKSRSIREKFNDKRGLAKTFNSLGLIYSEKKDLDSAKIFYERAIKLDRQIGDLVALSADQLALAVVYKKIGDYDTSVQLSIEALEQTNDVRIKLDILNLLGENYDALKEFSKSSQTKGKLIQLKDSVFKAEKEASLQEFQVQFNTEQKEAEIKQLTAEGKIKDLQSKQDAQTRWILVFFTGVLVIIALLLYSRFRTKARSNQLLNAKNEELAKLNQTKDRLFSIISHDLKSPLSSFHTITKNLSDNWDNLEKEQLKSFIETLRDSSANVRDMMENLLKWALTQTDQLGFKSEKVDVAAVLDRVQNQLHDTSELKKIVISKKLGSGAEIKADSQFVEIILRNILSNALKFSEIGGEVAITIHEHGTKQSIAITDHGVGMDQRQIEQLIKGEILANDIQNSTEKGTGLGLTLSKELMDKMGADISVESQTSVGTTFTLTFDQAA